MTRKHPWLVAVLAAGTAACGARSPSPPQVVSPKSADTSTASGGSTAPDAAFGVRPFAFGPYLAAAFDAGSGGQFSVEFGYVDLRKQRGTASGVNDISNQRWRIVSASSSPGHLTGAPTPGCAVAKAATFAAPAADAVAAAGATTAAPPKDDRNLFVFETTTDTPPLDELKALDVSFTKAGAELLRLTVDPPPKPGVVSLGGAYDINLNITTNVSYLGGALKTATGPLMVRDGGNGEGHDLVVVTFLGGQAAANKAVRCILPAGGEAEMPQDLYRSLMPLHGFFSMFARVKAETGAAGAQWTAAVSGDGAFDATVP